MGSTHHPGVELQIWPIAAFTTSRLTPVVVNEEGAGAPNEGHVGHLNQHIYIGSLLPKRLQQIATFHATSATVKSVSCGVLEPILVFNFVIYYSAQPKEFHSFWTVNNTVAAMQQTEEQPGSAAIEAIVMLYARSIMLGLRQSTDQRFLLYYREIGRNLERTQCVLLQLVTQCCQQATFICG